MLDDHCLLQEGLSRLLENIAGLHVVGQCTNVAEAISAHSDIAVDKVLLDFDLGQEVGFSLLAEVRMSKPEIIVLMLTGGMTNEATIRVMEAGALGVFLKHSNPDQLVAASRWQDEGLGPN
jgi:DNA-binding NarL/FixJ family response regulator